MTGNEGKFDSTGFCKENFVLDAHSDIFWHVQSDDYDILKRNDTRHFDIPRAKSGGLDLMVMASCFNEENNPGREAYEYTIGLIRLMNEVSEASGGKFVIIDSSDELIKLAPADSTLGYIVALEGGAPLEGKIERFDEYFDAGMRLMTLTHNASNEISQGALVETGPFYITGFGWEVIAACEEKGVLLDAAHLHTENMKFLIDLCTRPFTVSHAGCRTLVDDPRNIRDDHFLEMGRKGCVIGIDLIQHHIKAGPNSRDAALDDFLDHIEHVAKVAGVDAVGIGSDMDINPTLPKGLEDASSYPAIAQGLHERGWEDGDIAKVMGGNFKRLFEEILP